ncbi:MAG: ABC transporter ATP-binding protein, partial [Candidatus Cloacimonadaceae bacterium]|nr:ABC transporter ATP-binding protein [Candidatus Cloacimonadaceae bacterium]
LSGGEKSRLYLSVLIHQNPNLLIMDEPTNHLDIDMSDALLNALQDYQGTIIFVSHDRYFMRGLAKKYWVFRKAIKGTKIYTTIEEIVDELEKAIAISFEVPELQKTTQVIREKKKKVNPWHLEQLHKELLDKQNLLNNLKVDLSQIHIKLADSGTYVDASQVLLLKQHLVDIEIKIDRVNSEIGNIEDKYLELSYEDA